MIDFHALRHTCGAWLAMAGVHPKIVQTVMRHSSITLTMDTYGHLFPGQEADAVAKLHALMAKRPPGSEAVCGTPMSNGASAQAQRAGREMSQAGGTECDAGTNPKVQRETPKHREDAGLGGVVLRGDASSSGGGTRTPDTRIMIPLL